MGMAVKFLALEGSEWGEVEFVIARQRGNLNDKDKNVNENNHVTVRVEK